MTDFEVRTNSLNNISSNFSQISSRVRNISNEARSVLSSTRGSITARLAYSLQRSVVCGNIDKCSTDYKNLSSALKKVSVLYNQCEKKVEGQKLFDETFTLQDLLNVWDWLNSPIFDLAKNFPKSLLTLPMFISPWNIIKPTIRPRTDAEFTHMLFENFLGNAWKATGVTAVGATGSVLFKGFRDLGSFGNAMKTLFKDGKIAGSLAEGSAYINGKIAGIDTGASVKGDVIGASVSTTGKAKWDLDKGDVGAAAGLKAEVHLASGEAEGFIGLLKGKVKGKIGSADAQGNLEASLWKDGKFAPSIGVEGKASAKVAEGEVEVSYGSDKNNVHVGAEGSVLGAEAEAYAKAGKITYIDEKTGKPKTKYGVDADVGAEAYIAQGEIKAGRTFWGIKVDVSLEGKIGGAGAAAGAEVSTGGVGASLDLGLGAGAGVSVNVDWTEFDASEMQKSIENVVDGAVNTAKAVGNAAVEGAKAVGNAVEDGLDALGDLFDF